MIIAFIVFPLFFFVVFKSLGFITHHGQKIEVPDLSKKPIYEVEEILGDMNLRWVIQDSIDFNPEFPKNSVARQNPLPGAIVKTGRKIYLTLNATGYRKVQLPEFYGNTKRNVETTLKALGFQISGNYEYVPDIGKDVVRGLKFKGVKLNPGDKLQKKSIITLVLGKGGEEEVVGDEAPQDIPMEEEVPGF
jgi:beta-lactam-binding protein with PASTA domain